MFEKTITTRAANIDEVQRITTYVKSLLYMLVVLVVYLPVPTTIWKYENTGPYNLDCWMYTNLYFYIFICKYKDEYDHY